MQMGNPRVTILPTRLPPMHSQRLSRSFIPMSLAPVRASLFRALYRQIGSCESGKTRGSRRRQQCLSPCKSSYPYRDGESNDKCGSLNLISPNDLQLQGISTKRQCYFLKLLGEKSPPIHSNMHTAKRSGDKSSRRIYQQQM